jgi:hypothetical protein
MIDGLHEDLNDIIQSQLQIFERLSFPIECEGQGWLKLVDFNLETNSEEPCPGSWVKEIDSGIPHCRLSSPSEDKCQSASFSNNSLTYSQVCGRIKGYQIGRTSAFSPSSSSIDENYLDGVSITRGSPREHVWSFGSGFSSSSDVTVAFRCTCDGGPSNAPSFVNSNNFCESGASGNPVNEIFYDANPLWDAEGCPEGSQCCSKGRYFFTTLSGATCDPLEVRICSNDVGAINIGVSIIELYVK